MKYDPDKHHRRSIRLKGYDYTATGMYFITICTYQRECLFGEIMNGEMQLNQLGQRVYACWQRLPFYFSNLNLDASVVMPNHIHGILVLTHPPSNATPSSDNKLNPPRRGAALDHNSQSLLSNFPSNATPGSDNGTEANMTLGRELSDITGESEPGAAFGRRSSDVTQDCLPNAAPLPCLVAGSVGAIVLNFKSVTTRLGNRMR